MIIDIHMHLGNFLYPHGGTSITQKTEFPRQFNIQRFEEDILHFRSTKLLKRFFEKYDDAYTKSVQERVFAASISNYQYHKNKLKKLCLELFSDEEIYCACMPIAPNVQFEDIYNISRSDLTLLPFTSINPDISISDACETLNNEIDRCFGVKLHPILQGIAFDSDRVFSTMEVIRYSGIPVLFHAGASRYYLGREKIFQHCEFDNVKAAMKLVSTFPDIPFIIGHAGIAEYREWAEILRKFDNIFCDCTVQSVISLREILNAYGEDRILYGSDWPCIRSEPTIWIYRKALKSSQLEKCFYKNAQQLLKINSHK